MPIAADLDHVALAAEHADLLWPRYAGDLGGRWQGGGLAPGFFSAQVAYGNGMKVEALHPALVEQNDFLRRFLDANGPGPHHVTFKVPDLRAAIAAADEAGYPPINVDLSDPGWQEAFLHPKTAHGIVVQLAQTGEGGSWVPEPEPAGFPHGPQADLVRLVHLVADLDAAAGLFAGLLGGEATPADDALGPAIDIAWPGPGRIRLVRPRADARLRGRSGRLHHVRFSVSAPDTIPGAVQHDDGTWVVPAEANLGTRLVLATA